MAKYGSLFEDCQGRQVIRYGATYDIIPSERTGGFKVNYIKLKIKKGLSASMDDFKR